MVFQRRKYVAFLAALRWDKKNTLKGNCRSLMQRFGALEVAMRQYTLASGGPYCDCGYKKKIN